MEKKKETAKTQPKNRSIAVAHTLVIILGLGAIAGSIALGLYKDWTWWATTISVIATSLVAFVFYGVSIPDEEGEEDKEIRKDTTVHIFAPVFGLCAMAVAIIVGFFVSWPWWAILILVTATDLVAFLSVAAAVYNDEEEEEEVTTTTTITKKKKKKNEAVHVVNSTVKEDQQTTITTTKKKKKDDDDEGCGFIFIKLALIVIVVCVAYFTKPSDAKIWDEISKKELILKAPPRIHDFFVFKVAKYNATDLNGEHSGVAIALFGFVWIP